jgi:hypothetical protein
MFRIRKYFLRIWILGIRITGQNLEGHLITGPATSVLESGSWLDISVTIYFLL